MSPTPFPGDFKHPRSRLLRWQPCQCGLTSSALVFLTSSLISPVVVVLSLLFLLHFIPCLTSWLPSPPNRKSGAVLRPLCPFIPACPCLLHPWAAPAPGPLLAVHRSGAALRIRPPGRWQDNARGSRAAGDGDGAESWACRLSSLEALWLEQRLLQINQPASDESGILSTFQVALLSYGGVFNSRAATLRCMTNTSK